MGIVSSRWSPITSGRMMLTGASDSDSKVAFWVRNYCNSTQTSMTPPPDVVTCKFSSGICFELQGRRRAKGMVQTTVVMPPNFLFSLLEWSYSICSAGMCPFFALFGGTREKMHVLQAFGQPNSNSRKGCALVEQINRTCAHCTVHMQ